jgi:transposase
LVWLAFIAGEDRRERLLLPDCLDDYVTKDNLVRVVDVFVDELDPARLGFAGPAATGRPGYSPATMLKLYLYGYLNQVQSSRRLEREAGRNVECMWLTGKLAPDFKTIADFRRDNGEAIRAVCRQFVLLCRKIGLIAGGTVAVDGSRFKAVNTRDKNYTPGAIRLRKEQVDASIARYLGMLERTAMLPATFAMAPRYRFRLSGGHKANGAAQATAFKLIAHDAERSGFNLTLHGN